MTVRPCVKLFSLVTAFVFIALAAVDVPTTSASSFVDQVIQITNYQRNRIMGPQCPQLVANDALMQAAQEHASDMAAYNYFSHSSRDGASSWDRIRTTGYSARRTAENIAAGNVSAEEVVNMWLQSSGHRYNLLNCNLHEIGVGVAENSATTYGRYWVQDFATAR